MTKYKTVKRPAQIGERILITDEYISFGEYQNGSVLAVTSDRGRTGAEDFVQALTVDVGISDKEYEVIIDDLTSDIENASLAFFQHGEGDKFVVYQDGVKVEGIRNINIFAGKFEATTHEIEYATGTTKAKGSD